MIKAQSVIVDGRRRESEGDREAYGDNPRHLNRQLTKEEVKVRIERRDREREEERESRGTGDMRNGREQMSKKSERGQEMPDVSSQKDQLSIGKVREGRNSILGYAVYES